MLVAEAFVNAFPPLSFEPFPFVHLNPATVFLIDGPPRWVLAVRDLPAGLAGFSVRIQGYVVNPLTQSGIFGASNAHDVVLF